MFPFGKKKEKEIEEDELLEESLPPKKKFRDLKPENKEKRKEPIKPWGKSERILVLFVLGVTVGASAILGAVARGGITIPNFFKEKPSSSIKINTQNNFSLGQTFTFTKNNSTSCCQKPILDFKNLTDNLTGDYGFYVIRLDGSAQYGFNEDDSFKAASLIKVPTAVTVFKEFEEGNLNLDSSYVLKDSDKQDGNGSMNNYPAGTSFTFRKILEYMLNKSDNTAFNIYEIYLGDRKIQETILALGMEKTSIYDNLTSPKDIAELFLKIKNAEVLNRQDSDELLFYLRNTGFDAWIESGVPKGVTIEHKYGRLGGVVNDAGIVYSKRPYILVITSSDVDENEADMVLPKISKEIFDFENSN